MRLQQKEFFERLMRDKPLSATRLVVPFPIVVSDDFIIGNERGDPVRFFSDIHGSTLCVHFPVRVNATVQSRGMEYVVTDVRAMRFCDAMKEEKAAEKLGLADKVVDGGQVENGGEGDGGCRVEDAGQNDSGVSVCVCRRYGETVSGKDVRRALRRKNRV